ncbi:WD40 repeat-like protein [Neoconidiobolus thromboides FSU 785]|nr:WD40 repeat-like protein [Neoconidiobolus thromboides FSU 785]
MPSSNDNNNNTKNNTKPRKTNISQESEDYESEYNELRSDYKTEDSISDEERYNNNINNSNNSNNNNNNNNGNGNRYKSPPQVNDMFRVFSSLQERDNKPSQGIKSKVKSSDNLILKNQTKEINDNQKNMLLDIENFKNSLQWENNNLNNNNNNDNLNFNKKNSYLFNGPLNSIAPNPSFELLAVAGREVLKVIKFSEEEINEYINLRVGYRLNLNFSSNDVAWGIGYSQDKLATASTNGSVVLWDLNKYGQKIERLITGHSRAVNKVKFHPFSGQLLFSAAQDGFIKVWDIRTKESAKLSFNPKSEAVRDFQFNPLNTEEFVAAFESGSIQVWDIRNPTQYLKKFTAHTGIALTVDWNSDGRTIASGGRDKQIKIWDTKSDSRKPNGLIQTIAAVSKIRWRPNHLHQIASTSLNIDYSINVWDINRPYLPKYNIIGHNNITTDIYWAGSDEIFSCSKDHYFLRREVTDISSFTQPSNYLNTVALSWNPYGDISFVLETTNNETNSNNNSEVIKNYKRNEKNYLKKRSENLFRMIPLQSSGILHVPTFDFRTFSYFAINYSLDSNDILSSTEHNYLVAYQAEHFRAAQTWKMIQLIFGKFLTKNESDDDDSDDDNLFNYSNQSFFKLTNNNNINNNSTVINNSNKAQLINTQSSTNSITQLKTTNKTRSYPYLENEELPDDDYLLDAVNLIERLSEVSEDDIDNLKDNNNNNNIIINPLSAQPSTAVSTSTATPAIPTQSNTPGNRSPKYKKIMGSSNLIYQSNKLVSNKLTNSNNNNNNVNINSANTNNNSINNNQFPNNWKVNEIISEIIEYYNIEGDIQMCSIILILLNNRIEFNLKLKQNIIKSYIELLDRFKLYNISNEIILKSEINEIQLLNQESTTIYTMCFTCKKPLINNNISNNNNNSNNLKDYFQCEKCNTIIEKCSICSLLVKGSFVWCQYCGHGGHANCISLWFEMNSDVNTKGYCPTGCGHQCDFIINN